ncbi:MAG: hypothetical protein AAFN79_15340 [Pseudomonadota bacterium]
MGVEGEDRYPDYLLDVVAREAFENDGVKAIAWADLPAIGRAGWLETAKVILAARAAQKDIKR